MSELSRLVNLVPYLRAHPGVSVEEAAAEFGVKPKRILDDLAILQFVGLPGGYYGDLFEMDVDGARDDGTIFVSNVEPLGRPMTLTADQAASLLVALQMVIELGGDNEAAKSAKTKLEVVTRHAAPPVDVAVESGDEGIRAKLTEALADGRAVRISYRAGGKGDMREAVVEPGRMRTDAGFVYLDAWSRARDAWRTFRLDRLVGVEVLDETVAEREVPASLDSWFGEAAKQLTITVTRAGRWAADYYPTSAVEETEDGLEITFPVVSEDWAARLLLRLGDEILACSDASVVAKARQIAAEALRHYE